MFDPLNFSITSRNSSIDDRKPDLNAPLRAGKGMIRQDIATPAKAAIFTTATIASILFPPIGMALLLSATYAKESLSIHLINLVIDNKIKKVEDAIKTVQALKKQMTKMSTARLSREEKQIFDAISRRELSNLGAGTEDLSKVLPVQYNPIYSIVKLLNMQEHKHWSGLINVATAVLLLEELSRNAHTLYFAAQRDGSGKEPYLSELQTKIDMLKDALSQNWPEYSY